MENNGVRELLHELPHFGHDSGGHLFAKIQCDSVLLHHPNNILIGAFERHFQIAFAKEQCVTGLLKSNRKAKIASITVGCRLALYVRNGPQPGSTPDPSRRGSCDTLLILLLLRLAVEAIGADL